MTTYPTAIDAIRAAKATNVTKFYLVKIDDRFATTTSEPQNGARFANVFTLVKGRWERTF